VVLDIRILEKKNSKPKQQQQQHQQQQQQPEEEVNRIPVQSSTPNETNYNNNIDIVNQRIHYGHHPKEFMKTFARCSMDKKCHIVYFHIQKTGGTYIASRLSPVMNLERYNSKEWCCHDSFMNNSFRPNITEYCNKKMGIYEVTPEQYIEIINTCTRAVPSDHTVIGLITIREPIQRTISQIHQFCNVNPDRNEQYIQDICQRCNYTTDDDKYFYDKITNKTNLIYTGVQDIISDTTIDVPLLILDNTDITEFFDALEDIATQSLRKVNAIPRNETFHFSTGRSNPERKTICDFGMPSSMMKQHADSLRTYRWILQGMY
jgi:hypothetical protein